MANKPLRPCREPGCPRYAEPGTHTCNVHKQPRSPVQGEAAILHWLYTQRAWIDGRAAFLALLSLCVECEKLGILTAATIVDHVIPHEGDLAFFYDQNNWQSLCKWHHDIKTVARDGVFGNKRIATKC